MTQTHSATVLRQIRKLAAAANPLHLSDAQLLESFLAERDEAAFAALVQRHGPMVLGVCRSVLRHQQDAEDVFQATFLVLARKAHSIRKHQAMSSWLHGVAYRLALKARTQAHRRLAREKSAAAPEAAPASDDLSLRELRAIVHEELHRLPEKYRAPLLLCYLEGKTRDEAAERIGLTAGAFKKCLERGRNLLGSRLAGRGVAPSAAILATLFADLAADAAVSHPLTQSTASAAVAFAVGNGAGATTTAAALAEGAIRTMTITKWTATCCILLFLAALGAGLSFAAYEAFAGGQDRAAPRAFVPVIIEREQPVGKKKTDLDRFVGVWRFTKGRANGKDMPDEFITLARYTFTRDGKAIMTMLEQKNEGQFKLVGPGKIDVSMDDKGNLSKGIYKFESDNRLILCAGTGKRPTLFTGAEGTDQSVLILTRAKPGEEKPTAKDIAKLKGGIEKVREAAHRAISVNNLKQIGLAMHNYHDQIKEFPAQAIYSKDGKTPLLSWRVAILPYIDQTKLYEQFKLDQPWDSPHNKKLIAKMPKIYEPVGLGKVGGGKTHYQVFSGPDTIFNGAAKMRIQDITDGTSNTIMVIEAKNAVVWTKPADLTLPKDKDKLPAVGGLFKNGMNVLLGDGSVRFLPSNTPAATLRPMITPAGGEPQN